MSHASERMCGKSNQLNLRKLSFKCLEQLTIDVDESIVWRTNKKINKKQKVLDQFIVFQTRPFLAFPFLNTTRKKTIFESYLCDT